MNFRIYSFFIVLFGSNGGAWATNGSSSQGWEFEVALWLLDQPGWWLATILVGIILSCLVVAWMLLRYSAKSEQSSRSMPSRRTFWPVVLGAILLGSLLVAPLKEFTLTKVIDLAPPAAGPKGHLRSPLGMNLSPLVDWSDSQPFIDRFKLSRQWIPLCIPNVDPGCNTWWDTGERDQIELDESGWVRRLPAGGEGPTFTRVATLLMTSGQEGQHEGNYVVRYEGEGEIRYEVGATLIEGSPGRDLIHVAPGGNVRLVITRTDPEGTGNYIRNIQVVPEALEAQSDREIFDPVWLSRLEPFRTLRFMDWMRTNGSQQREFSDRAQESDARYTSLKGAPVEVMVKLANATRSEPWFSIPHGASDDYVQNFARLVKNSLNSNLRVYVEYSNEVWNGAFSQGRDIETWAKSELPGSSDSGFTKRLNWYGRRSAEVCQYWKSVFGAQSNRVQCVLGAQAANPWTASQALDCPLYQSAMGGRSCQSLGLDSVAIAPYFGGYLGHPAYQDQVRQLSVDDLFTEINRGGVLTASEGKTPPARGALYESYEWMDRYAALANDRDLQVLAYEGGQHLAGIGNVMNDPEIENLFKEVNRDPRMGHAYADYLNYWRSEPSGRLTLFAPFLLAQRYGKFGSWGILEQIDQAESPKYDALLQWADFNECWWWACGVNEANKRAPGGVPDSK